MDSLQAILSDLPGFSMVMPPADGPDFRLRWSGRPGNAVLAVDVKAHLWPNEVRSVAHNLLAYCRSEKGSKHVPIIMAPRVSERAADVCSELGLNWADFAGNCHIQFDDVLIRIKGEPNTHIEKRGTSSMYSPMSSRVVHAILLEPLKTWRVVDLAIKANVSIGQVSNVRQLLLRDAFAEGRSEGLRVVDPTRLLTDWAANYKPRRVTNRYYTPKRPADLEATVAAVLPTYALAEMSAAEKYAPYTRYQNVSFYTLEWHSRLVKKLDLLKELDLRPAENSANVAVYEGVNAHLFAEIQGSYMCVSPVITYLDLVQLGGRGHDAAEHLLETTLLSRWQ